MLTRAADGATPPAWQDSALYVALAMAAFAMLFGTRRASAAEHNRGLVLAMAFESLFKLAAMLALGVFVWFGLRCAAGTCRWRRCRRPPSAGGFLPLVLLGAFAMFTLPHQFHVARGRVPRRAPRAHRALAVPAVPAADRAAGAAAGARRRRAAGAAACRRTCTCWRCRCRRASTRWRCSPSSAA